MRVYVYYFYTYNYVGIMKKSVDSMKNKCYNISIKLIQVVNRYKLYKYISICVLYVYIGFLKGCGVYGKYCK